MGLENTPPNIPAWPASLTPEDRHRKHVREQAYNESLRRILSPTRWRFSHGSMFRTEHDWYLANLPTLAYGEGVVMCLSYKPMAIDPLFWDVMGLSVDAYESLPFRNQVPYAIRAPSVQAFIGTDISSEEELARLTLHWTEDWFLSNRQKLDEGAILQSLGELGSGPSDERTFALYLSILLGDLETATDLTRVDMPDAAGGESGVGSLPFIQRGGETLSIYDKTRGWLATQNKKHLRLVK